MLSEKALVFATDRPPLHIPLRALQHRIFTLLQTCESLPKLSQIHAQIISHGLSQNCFLLSKLISLYTTFGSFRLAHQVFDGLAIPSTSAWNQMIRLGSVEALNRMRIQGLKPDEYSYSYGLSACVQFGMLGEGKQIHGRVVSEGYGENVVIGTGLVNLYGSGENGDELLCARKVFDEMSERNVVAWNSLLAGYVRLGDLGGAMRVFDEMPERSVVSWTTMVSGCARQGQFKRALSYFNEMRRSYIELDQVALVSALSACAELGDLDLGRWIHSYVNKTFQGRNRALLVSLQNTLIHMYTSCGVINEACKIFEEIPCKTVVSYTSMIIAYANHGHAEEALSLFKSMEANQVGPDAITFIGVLCACSHSGLVEQGRRHFTEMKDKWGIELSIEHYGCMVDLLSRAGLLGEAMRMIQSMPMEPNNFIWGALLGGCRIHKNIKIASYAGSNLMLECDPDEAMGYLLLLSDVYGMGGMWKDVGVIKEKMIRIGGTKSLGRSWIQVNGIIHDFAAGDWNHQHAVSVYGVLDSISGLMMSDVCDDERKKPIHV